MGLRQEQVVFVGAALLLGSMSYFMIQDSGASRRSRRSNASELEFEDYRAPKIEIALSNGRTMPLERELFHPPRDTRPLPLLPLIEPPRLELEQLFAPSDPGPRPKHFGRLLRRSMSPVEDLELFGTLAQDFEEEAPLSSAELLTQAGESESTDHGNETPAETKARLEGYLRKYDWILRGAGNQVFGRILNEDRFGLRLDANRLGEPLLFVEVIPETGEARYKSIGAEPIQTPWTRLSEFGFADTAANRLELRRAAFQGALGRVDFQAALQLADDALALRLEVPRGLEIAEEMYQLCIDYDPKDLRSQLGAVAVLEAGFRFEEALAGYQKLEANFGNRAEVHVKLAQLDERFLSYDTARQGFERAISLEPSSWQARLALGEFLMRRGESALALEQLRAAHNVEPSAPELLARRVAIREALGDALFAEGDLEQAARIYRSALSADASTQRAKAGLLSIALYSGPAAGSFDLESETNGYALQLARGLMAMAEGRNAEARDRFQAALAADPLRAVRPYAALSCLAFLTGNDGEALAFIESALEAQPRDAYSLYWRGRLLSDQGDFEGAKASLLAALDVELDFEDALVALGELAFKGGDFADAERFLGRALGLNDRRTQVHSLAAMNHLRLGDVDSAQEAFGRALSLDPDNAHAASGLAWCAYLEGDSIQARVQLSNLDDARRSFPEDDPWRLWSREQIARIDDHSQKVEWSDNFNRQLLINGWYAREGTGPLVSMFDGSVKIEGVFDKEGSASVFREYRASDFVSVAIDLWVDAKTKSRAGVFLARERRRGLSTTVIGELQVGRHSDGSLQIRSVSSGKEPVTVDMQQAVDTGRWVRFMIERDADEEGTGLTISMDGIRLIEGLDVPALKGANATLLLGVSAEGKSGQEVRLLVDEAVVVHRDLAQ